MTIQTFWYGKVVIEKPARVSPGGEASSIVFKKNTIIKCDAEDGRWLRPIATSVWVAKDWLADTHMVEEETGGGSAGGSVSSNPAWFKLTSPEGVEDYYDKRV